MSADEFTRKLRAAAERWGMTIEDYQRRAVLDLVAVERPTSVNRRSAPIRDIARAFGESAEALTRRAVQKRMAADEQLFDQIQRRPGGQIQKTGTKPGHL